MKKKHRNTALAAMCGFVLMGLAAGMYEKDTDEISQLPEQSLPRIAAARAESTKPRYILGEHEGKLAVYLYGSDEPEIVFNVFLHYLPDVDRQRLTKGIEVPDDDTLIRMIEDYTS